MNYSRPAACVIGPSAIDMVGCAEADRRAVVNGIEVHSRPSTSMLSTDSEFDLVCLVLLAKGNEEVQLTALASVARRLRTPKVLQELRRAPNRVVLYNVMKGRGGPDIAAAPSPCGVLCLGRMRPRYSRYRLLGDTAARAPVTRPPQSAALLRNWTKMSKCASISVEMGTVRTLNEFRPGPKPAQAGSHNHSIGFR